MGKVKRKSKKMNKRMNKMLYVIAALVGVMVVLTSGIMAMMVADEIEEGKPPKRIEDAHLVVEDVFFMKSNSRADEEKLDISTTIYITNDGLGDADNVKVIAYALDEKKNLAADEQEENVGRIFSEKTESAKFFINVPAGMKYYIELLIFENGRLILRGDSSVVIQGEGTATNTYNTKEVKGTKNDKDYDGIPDDWEQYYGLNPSDPSDAYEDADGDGLSNYDEYLWNSTPKKPVKDDGMDADEMDSSVISLVGIIIFVIILIIIIVVVGVVSNNPTKQKIKNNNQDYTQSAWGTSNKQSGLYQNPYQPQSYWQCQKCGGWITNGACTRCGEKYTITPANKTETEKDENEINDET
jgi:biotin transporter BioY